MTIKRRDEIDQLKIDIERTAWRILKIMIIGGSLSWTIYRLTWELIEPIDLVSKSIEWLLDKKFIQRRGNRLWKTLDGENAYADQAHSKHFRTGVSCKEFRVEALTGMDTSGNQTRLTRAVLPPSSNMHDIMNKEENIAIARCEKNRRVHLISIEMGLSESETEDGLSSGRIKKCKGIDGIEPHWGIFYPSRTGRHGWQAICCECQKIQQKRRRKN